MKSGWLARAGLLNLVFLCTLVAGSMGPVSAHNVAVVHPLITERAMHLLREFDISENGGNPSDFSDCPECEFTEVWENAGSLEYPGTTTSGRSDLISEDNSNYQARFNGGDYSIMLGAVIEDGHNDDSEYRVVNHFYHARTGAGLLGTFDSSFTRSETLFLAALGMFDYTDDSKARAFLYLGRVLHLIEDLSSPAHIHNDAHLYKTIGPISWETDKDDYEGRFVPNEIWVNQNLQSILDNATAPKMVTGASAFWSSPAAPLNETNQRLDDNSLSGFVYNRSTYWQNLEFPIFDLNPAEEGELTDMFPGVAGDPMDDGLHYDTTILLDPHWQIDGVGQYYHLIPQLGSENDWFPDGASDESNETPSDPDGVLAPYYLEQLMQGETAADAVVPLGFRTAIDNTWVDPGNPVIPNAVSIVQRQADSLLPAPVEYVAGGAMWFYRIANTPPILKKIEVKQQQDGTDVIRYMAEWEDVKEETVVEIPEVTFLGVQLVPNTIEEFEIVNERKLNRDLLNLSFINAQADLTLRLEFNEPIKQVSEIVLKSGILQQLDVLSVAGDPVKEMEDTVWAYTVPAASLDGLEGKLTLSVRAQDKNEHWLDEGGELDATPGTPAKRAIGAGFRAVQVPWHTAASSMPEFAYDFATGDETHVLLFDSKGPTSSLQSTP